jgi:hypothetical protein
MGRITVNRSISHLVFAAAGLVSGGCTSEVSRLDAQVRELCKKDGGVYVYEQVILPAERFNEFGEIRVPPKDRMNSKDPFFYESHGITYREGNPHVWRSHYKLYRASDQRLLGEAITYGRRGGDLLPPESSFVCPEHASIKHLNQRVFQRNAQPKGE